MPSHRLHHPVKQPEQTEAQILFEFELPVRFGPRASEPAAVFHLSSLLRLKTLDQASPLQVSFQDSSGDERAVVVTEPVNFVQLQLGHSPVPIA